MVKVDSKVGPVDGSIEICIVEDDGGRFATQFQSNLLQVAIRGSLHDRPTRYSRPSECNLVNSHVSRNGCTGSLSKPRDDVDDTRRESSLDDELGGDECRERCLLG